MEKAREVVKTMIGKMMEMEACSPREGTSPFNSCVSVGCEQKSTSSQCPSTTARDSFSSSRRQNEKNKYAAQSETQNNKEREPSVGDLSDAKFHHLYNGHSLLQRGTSEPLSISESESPRSSTFHHNQPNKNAKEPSHIEILDELSCLNHEKDYRRRRNPSPDVLSIGNIRDLDKGFHSNYYIHRQGRQRKSSIVESLEISVNAGIQNYSYTSLVPINTHGTETPREKAAKQYTTLEVLRRQLDYDFKKSLSHSKTTPVRDDELMHDDERCESTINEDSMSLLRGDISDRTNSAGCQYDSSRQNDDKALYKHLSLDGMSLKNLRERMKKIDLEHRISVQRGKLDKHSDSDATMATRLL